MRDNFEMLGGSEDALPLAEASIDYNVSSSMVKTNESYAKMVVNSTDFNWIVIQHQNEIL